MLRPMSRPRLGLVAALVAAVPVASALAAEQAKRVPTFRCAGPAFEATVDPAGAVRVAQQRYDSAHRTFPTGVTLAVLDAAGGRAGPLCTPVRAPAIRTIGLAGPYPRAVAGRVFCARDALVGWAQPARSFAFQFRPVLGRRRNRVGTEMLVSVNGAPALRIRITRSGGGVWYAADRCLRNKPPSG
jgi:hypothetical protein